MTSNETALDQNQIYFSNVTMHGNREEMDDFDSRSLICSFKQKKEGETHLSLNSLARGSKENSTSGDKPIDCRKMVTTISSQPSVLHCKQTRLDFDIFTSS